MKDSDGKLLETAGNPHCRDAPSTTDKHGELSRNSFRFILPQSFIGGSFGSGSCGRASITVTAPKQTCRSQLLSARSHKGLGKFHKSGTRISNPQKVGLSL